MHPAHGEGDGCQVFGTGAEVCVSAVDVDERQAEPAAQFEAIANGGTDTGDRFIDLFLTAQANHSGSVGRANALEE
ncbi:hypothetical protein [Streptomyces sp. A5-4]|uniref:hypothetical protein n=1 Tax=Streptomyces sp. A5-4 TaxID=3384771 RepID=UPI003DA97CAE